MVKLVNELKTTMTNQIQTVEKKLMQKVDENHQAVVQKITAENKQLTDMIKKMNDDKRGFTEYQL